MVIFNQLISSESMNSLTNRQPQRGSKMYGLLIADCINKVLMSVNALLEALNWYKALRKRKLCPIRLQLAPWWSLTLKRRTSQE